MSTDDSVVTEEPTSHPLTGRFFHTTRTCHHGARVAQWQGQILAAIPPDVLLIELCDWIIGEPSGQELITLTDFMAKDPVLYDDAEWMRFSYQHGALSHTTRCDDPEPTTPEGNR
jgi:hypothetical protein